MALFNNKLTEDEGGIQQDQRFVLLLMNSNILLIYTNGLLFQNLGKYNSNGKDCTALLAQAPKLKGWDAYSWYNYYNKMVRACKTIMLVVALFYGG